MLHPYECVYAIQYLYAALGLGSSLETIFLLSIASAFSFSLIVIFFSCVAKKRGKVVRELYFR